MVDSTYFDDDKPQPYMALPAEDGEDEPQEPTRSLRPVWIVLLCAMTICIVCLMANTLFVYSYVLVANRYLNGVINADGFYALMAPVYRVEPIADGLYLGGLVIALLAYLWFNVRALSNLKAFSSRHVPGSLTGVVLWQFVPIIQLVKPYQLMTSFWTRSREHLSESGKAPMSAHAWWLLWLGANLAAYAFEIERRIMSLQTQQGEPFDVEALRRLGYAAMINNALIILSIVFLLVFARKIARTQDTIHNWPPQSV